MNFIFEPFVKYEFMRSALIAALIITPMLGTLGTMAVSQNMAFFSDALGHSAMTGIAIGVMLGVGNLWISMVMFGVLLALLIGRIKAKVASSMDTVISVISSMALAFGLLILTRGGMFSKYSSLLVGDILAVNSEDIVLIAVVAVSVLIIYFSIYNDLALLSVNRSLAISRGVKAAFIESVFMIIVAIAVMTSIRWVGTLLINALIVLPAASSRNMAANARSYQGFAVLFALISAVIGLLISYYLNASAGASITLFLSVLFFATFMFRRK